MKKTKRKANEDFTDNDTKQKCKLSEIFMVKSY